MTRPPTWSGTATRSCVGDCELSVIHLRGHTPGSIALCYDAGGALRTRRTCSPATPCSPAGPATPSTTRSGSASSSDDLEDRVFGRLPDGTWVYPGHGKDTTLGAERPHVAEWRERGW